MVGFPKVIKTKADLVNTYKLVKKGRLKKEDWLAAVEKLENQNFIFCPILEKTEDRKGVTLMFVNEVTEGDKVKAGNVTATVKTVRWRTAVPLEARRRRIAFLSSFRERRAIRLVWKISNPFTEEEPCPFRESS